MTEREWSDFSTAGAMCGYWLGLFVGFGLGAFAHFASAPSWIFWALWLSQAFGLCLAFRRWRNAGDADG